jgi:pyruvate kinase
MLARYRPECPIVAVSENKDVRNKLLLSYGVKPYYVKFPKGSIHSLRVVFEYLVNRKALKKGDQVVVIKGKQWGVAGGTSTVSVETVGF